MNNNITGLQHTTTELTKSNQDMKVAVGTLHQTTLKLTNSYKEIKTTVDTLQRNSPSAVNLSSNADDDGKVYLRKGSQFKVSVERLALINSYSTENCARLASQAMTALCSLHTLYKSSVSGRGKNSNIKSIQKFPIEIIHELEELCRGRLPTKTTRFLEDGSKEDAGGWKKEVEKTVKRKLGCLNRFFEELRKYNRKLDRKDLEVSNAMKECQVRDVDLIGLDGLREMLNNPKVYFDKLDQDLFGKTKEMLRDAKKSSDGEKCSDDDEKDSDDGERWLNNGGKDSGDDKKDSYDDEKDSDDE